MKELHEKEMEDTAARGDYHIEPDSKVIRFHEVNCNGLPTIAFKEMLKTNKMEVPPTQEESLWWLKCHAKIFKSKVKK